MILDEERLLLEQFNEMKVKIVALGKRIKQLTQTNPHSQESDIEKDYANVSGFETY